MTISEAVHAGEVELAPSGIEDPRLNAELLLAHVLGRKRLELQLDPETPVEPSAVDRFHALVKERATRRPLQYVLGNQEFMGLQFEVGPAALVPRVDTEILVDAVIQRGELMAGELIIADIGTGCGPIALSLAHFLPEAKVYATDLSAAALALARRNAERLDVADRVTFGRGDLLAPLHDWELAGRVRIFTANLPYVPRDTIPRLALEIARYEPRVALDGGPNGLDVVRRFFDQIPAFLDSSGFLALEIGYDQSNAVCELLASREWCGSTEVLKDLGGKDRAIIAYGTQYRS